MISFEINSEKLKDLRKFLHSLKLGSRTIKTVNVKTVFNSNYIEFITSELSYRIDANCDPVGIGMLPLFVIDSLIKVVPRSSKVKGYTNKNIRSGFGYLIMISVKKKT